MTNRIADLEYNEELRMKEEEQRQKFPALQKSWEHYEFTKQLVSDTQ